MAGRASYSGAVTNAMQSVTHSATNAAQQRYYRDADKRLENAIKQDNPNASNKEIRQMREDYKNQNIYTQYKENQLRNETSPIQREAERKASIAQNERNQISDEDIKHATQVSMEKERQNTVAQEAENKQMSDAQIQQEVKTNADMEKRKLAENRAFLANTNEGTNQDAGAIKAMKLKEGNLQEAARFSELSPAGVIGKGGVTGSNEETAFAEYAGDVNGVSPQIVPSLKWSARNLNAIQRITNFTRNKKKGG